MEGRFRNFDTQAETWTGTEDFESQSERRDLNGVEQTEGKFTDLVIDRRPLGLNPLGRESNSGFTCIEGGQRI